MQGEQELEDIKMSDFFLLSGKEYDFRPSV